MTLRIHGEAGCSPEQLRALLLDEVEQLAGGGSRVLEPKLPWEGHPILLVDAELHPVVVSFDVEQGQTALINGLAAVEKLSAALAWVNQVYESLQQRQQPPMLVVISPQYPPGTSAILSACPGLRLLQFRIMRVNSETGLWLEALTEQSRGNSDLAPPRKVTTVPIPVSDHEPPAEDDLPALSNEETTYFQQL